MKGLAGQYASINIATWGMVPTSGTQSTFNRTQQRGLEVEYQPFYINNTTAGAIQTTGRGLNMAADVNVYLQPGWNEYLFTSIVVPANAVLQWGM